MSAYSQVRDNGHEQEKKVHLSTARLSPVIALWSTERMLGPLSTPRLSSSPWSSLPSFSRYYYRWRLRHFFQRFLRSILCCFDLSAYLVKLKMSPDTASLMNLRHPDSSYASRQSIELSGDPCHCTLRGSTRMSVRVPASKAKYVRIPSHRRGWSVPLQ
jgi:hypothetical protein